MTSLVAALLAVAVLLLLVALRRLRGLADRIVVLDALAACAIAACLLAAAQSGNAAFLDVALGFALIAFLATLGWAHALAALDPEEEET